ncbi:4238_t:CDS:2 [Entrophospora sp. SA101]|nr:14725_t:CDS:2 [Entrophospora sp. SA101]CAJ0759249.1 4238_t:CDS:2 [Entrophospora sp. SA101]
MNLQYAYTTNIQTGVKTPLSIYQGALFLIHQEILLGALGIFALLVGFVITFFLFYQFYLIYCGTTSNEAFKWEDLDEIISNDELWPNIKKRQVSTDSKNSKNVNGNNNNSNNNGNDVNIPDSIIPLNSKSGSSNQHGNEKVNNQDVNYNNNSDNNKRVIGRPIKSLKEIKNIYDKGLFGNISEILITTRTI